jgi:N-carbamoyl-L-amino-acid hydrolase
MVNASRLMGNLESISVFGRSTGGADRVAYSQADRDARSWTMDLMRAAGLEPEIDVAGNILGHRPGTETGLPPLMFGSHIDSVPSGGDYDGPLGTLAAIETVQRLVEEGVTTRHPLEVVVFANEEGGKIGSRAMIGAVRAAELDLESASGRTIGEGIRFIGGNPEHLEDARRVPGTIAAFVELHVEQGEVLESEGVPIGIVEGIVGIRRWEVVVEGVANHAGTTPMAGRQDALVGAAHFVQVVNRIARETPGRQVATVGRIRAEPGAPNVIPGRVVLSLEIRDLEMDKIESVFRQIANRSETIGQETGTTFQLNEFYLSEAAPTQERIRSTIESVAGELNLPSVRMPSGAGHDAQSIAHLAPVGMIFIPSVGGVSHSPAEFSRPEDVVGGANVLLRTVLELDRMEWG